MSTKKLYLSRKDKKLAGVCGGVVKYFDIDPNLVRVLWILISLSAGFGVVAYLISWAIMPEDPEEDSQYDDYND